jgi:hypothetical protein
MMKCANTLLKNCFDRTRKHEIHAIFLPASRNWAYARVNAPWPYARQHISKTSELTKTAKVDLGHIEEGDEFEFNI